MILICLSCYMHTGKLQLEHPYARSDHSALKCKSKDRADASTGQLQLSQLSPRYLSRSCCRDSPGTCGLQISNLVSSEHMGQKWPYLHSSKQWIFTVIRTHLYTCALLMQKMHLIELIIGRWQRNCYTEMCRCILWNYLYFDIESKSLWYDGNGIMQARGAVVTIVVQSICRWPKPSPPSNRCRVLCRRCRAWVNSLSYADHMCHFYPR